jgi:putative methionine-R-sulfoxide reductase with GAF domain
LELRERNSEYPLMEQLGILGLTDPSQKLNSASVAGFSATSVPSGMRDRVRFPGEDNHRSLTQMAKTDLEAALQLLVDRAQYITGASGTAIALLENSSKMVCRASCGASAPAIGTLLQMDSGLTGESVRQKKLMRCDDVETDLRVNRESCRALRIMSVVVLPLLKEEQVVGLFELLSDKAYAFEERDMNAVERLGEMIQTALEVEPAAKPFYPLAAEPVKASSANAIAPSAPAVKTAAVKTAAVGSLELNVAKSESEFSESQSAGETVVPKNASVVVRDKFVLDLAPQDLKPIKPVDPGIIAQLHASIGKCASCGFPVSEGRKYCVECESSQPTEETTSVSAEAPDFLSSYSNQKQKNWFSRNIYWIGMVLVSLATAAFLVLRSK